MKTVFWKEMRENLKWGAVIFLALSLFISYELRRAGADFLLTLSTGTLIFMGPLCGLAMGAAQSWFETKMDNWAFVVHRPVPRKGVFAAKSAAGLALLYLGLGLPCALAALWAARPGNIAVPFQGRMVLPLAGDVLLSGCYYFAGVVLILRRARWFGTRLLPLALALGCSAFVTQMVPEFWQAVLIILAVQGVGLLAAWNAFGSAGEAEMGGLPSVGLGMMIYAGALGVGIFMVGLPNVFYSNVAKWTVYQVDRQGELIRIDWRLDNDRGRTSTVRNLSGEPITDYDGVDFDDPHNADLFVRFNSWLVDEKSITWPLSAFYTSRGFRTNAGGAIRLRAVSPPNVRMRFLPFYNVQRRLIELYDPVTRLVAGTVGPGGYSSAQEKPGEPFPAALVNPSAQASVHVLVFPSVVYWMELDQRRVRPIFQAAEEPIISAAELGPQTDPKAVIATRHAVYFLRPTGEQLYSLKLDWDPNRYFLQPAILPANKHPVLYVGTIPGTGWQDIRNEYLEFETDGTLIRTTKLPGVVYPGGVKVPETAVFGVTFPLWALPVVPGWLVDMVTDLRTEQFAGMFHGFVYGSSAACFLLTFLVARFYGFGKGKTVKWVVMNALLGPAGLVVMAGLNEKPAKERCPMCGRKRFTGRPICSACGAELEPAALNGREIFEPGEPITGELQSIAAGIHA